MSSRRSNFPPNLSLPHSSRYLVENPNLPSWLEESADASLILAVAPAGFGKSTALLALQERFYESGVQTIWIQLHADDDQLERFCTLMCDAMGMAPLNGAPAPTLFDAPHTGASITFKLQEMVAGLRQPTAIFLDDFDHIADPKILRIVQTMIESLPDRCRLIIAARAQPHLKLLKWKAQGKLLQISMRELSFDLEQTRTFLNLRHHLGLDDASIQRLHRSTEGWPTGLQLAALALHSRTDRRQFIESFDVHIADIGTYLYEEVLATQPEEIQSFLQRTSILTELTAPLCNAVADTGNSVILLRRLEQQNLFLVRIGSSGDHYRYHPLFAEYLQARLLEENAALLQSLHRKAASWYLENDNPVAAVDHALTAKDFAQASKILTTHAWTALFAGHINVCHSWLSAIPTTVLEQNPKLLLAKGWTHIFQHEYALARDLAHRLRDQPAMQDNSEYRILEPLTLGFMDQIAECETFLTTRLHDVVISGPAEGTLRNLHAYVHLCSHRFEQARHDADQAKTIFRRHGGLYGPAYSYGIEAHALLVQGRVEQAIDVLEPAFADTVARSGRHSTPSAHLAIYLAEALYERGATERAVKLTKEYIDINRLTGMADTIIVSHRLLSRSYAHAGDWQKARQVIEQGIEIGRQLGLRRILAAMRLEMQYQHVCQHDLHPHLELQIVQTDDPVWTGFTDRMAPANDNENPNVSWLRVWIRSGDVAQALTEAPAHIQAASQHKRTRLALKMRILYAQALAADGRPHLALAELQDALQMENCEACIASFRDEGPQVLALLEDLQKLGAAQQLPSARGSHTTVLQRIQQILASAPAIAFDPPSPTTQLSASLPAPQATHLPQTLSERELQILSCLAAGLPNKLISGKLNISEPTVKFHLRNINAKLRAKNRTHAVFIGRRLGWIAS